MKYKPNFEKKSNRALTLRIRQLLAMKTAGQDASDPKGQKSSSQCGLLRATGWFGCAASYQHLSPILPVSVKPVMYLAQVHCVSLRAMGGFK